MAQSPVLDATTSLGAAPVVFGPRDRAILGLYHPPEGAARDIGVVLCNPLGYESMCAHRTYRHLAGRLAARGVPALRFDYQGTGDSSGEAGDPGRVEAWAESIDAAIGELRRRAGVGFVALFGVRSGAMLALHHAATRDDVESLVLWAPVASGREFVRELRAFHLIRQQETRIVTAPRGGGEEAAGYHFDKETVDGLASIRPLAQVRHVARRALVVPRDDLHGAAREIAAHLEKCGAEVRLAPEPGYSQMMRDPQETVVPGETLDKMVDWLLEPAYPDARSRPSDEPAPAVLAASSPTRGAPVRETAVRFGPGQRLLGIVTESTVGFPGHRPAVAFLNVGANHRVGPNRMYVSLARDLAAAGYTCFRFDVAGLGDSQIAPGARENRLYSKDSVGDVKAAMTFLAETRQSSRFVLVGLCSGAYLAFHTCVEDRRVVGQILLNPQTFEWKEGDSLELSTRNSFLSTRFYVRALFSRATWRKAVKGRIHFGAIAGVLRERFVARATEGFRSIASRATNQAEPLTEVARAFRAVSARNVRSLLIFAFDDGGLDMIEKHLGGAARTMRGHDGFRFEIVDGADHTFTPLDSQRKMRDLVIQDICTQFP